MIPWPAGAILIVLAGLTLGSMVTTAALRAARAEQSVTGRSRCDGCGRTLSLAAATPVVSFLWFRGACGGCGAPIDRTHPVGEIAGLMVVAGAFATAPAPRALLIALLGLALLAAAVYDHKTRRLPDLLTLIVAACGAGLALLTSVSALAIGLAAAAVSFVLLQGVRLAFVRLRRVQAMGFGDVKLIAAVALWLGLATPWMLVLASGLGLAVILAVRPKDGRLPLGPMIATATMALGLWQEVGAGMITP